MNEKLLLQLLGKWFSQLSSCCALGIHFMYHIEYNPIVREVMELLQEKLFCISLPQGKKVSVAYSNIYRSLSCVEDKLMITDSTDENTMDETQAFCELAD